MKYELDAQIRWNQDLAYICGLITGDGSMPVATSRRPNGKVQNRYLIYFYCESLDFLKKVYMPLFKKLFGVELFITRHKIGVYNGRIESVAIYNFLRNIGLKVGRKARIASVPKMPRKYHAYFLAGLLDTDGGKKGSGFGFSTASMELATFCKTMFENLKIPYRSVPWVFKGHVYHQVYVHKKYAGILLQRIPFKNIEKIKVLQSMAINAPVAQPVER